MPESAAGCENIFLHGHLCVDPKAPVGSAPVPLHISRPPQCEPARLSCGEPIVHIDIIPQRLIAWGWGPPKIGYMGQHYVPRRTSPNGSNGSATVSMAAVKMGGDYFQPIGSTKGNPTMGTSPTPAGNRTPIFGTSSALIQIQ
jgi:hypothetical protein